jgi:integrase/recombinase XerD
MAPIGVHAVDWIRRYLQTARPVLVGRKDEHGKLFVSKSGKPMSPPEVTMLVSNCTGRLLGEDQRLSPHALRRSCATEMIRNGANPGHVKDILGHEDFQSLRAYVKLAAVDLKDALAKYHPRERGRLDDAVSAG